MIRAPDCWTGLPLDLGRSHSNFGVGTSGRSRPPSGPTSLAAMYRCKKISQAITPQSECRTRRARRDPDVAVKEQGARPGPGVGF